MARRRTPAQKAATRKLIAWNKAHRKNPSGGYTHHKKKTHHKKHSGGKHYPVVVVRSNPWRGHPAGHSAAAKKGWRKRKHHYRINPFGIKLPPMLNEGLMAGTGSVGVLGVEALLAQLLKNRADILLRLQTGYTRPLVQLGSGVALSFLANMFGAAGRRAAPMIGAGGVAIAMYTAGKMVLAKAIPTLQLGEALEYPSIEWSGQSSAPGQRVRLPGMGEPGMDGPPDFADMGSIGVERDEWVYEGIYDEMSGVYDAQS